MGGARTHQGICDVLQMWTELQLRLMMFDEVEKQHWVSFCFTSQVQYVLIISTCGSSAQPLSIVLLLSPGDSLSLFQSFLLVSHFILDLLGLVVFEF